MKQLERRASSAPNRSLPADFAGAASYGTVLRQQEMALSCAREARMDAQQHYQPCLLPCCSCPRGKPQHFKCPPMLCRHRSESCLLDLSGRS